jgi:hypothetical protein
MQWQGNRQVDCWSIPSDAKEQFTQMESREEAVKVTFY